MRIADIGQFRCLVVRLESPQNIFGFVVEIEHKGAGLRLPWIGTVQARQRLYTLHAAQLFIHIHGAQLGLVKTGLEFVSHQHYLVVVGIKRFTHIPALQSGVHIDLGELLVKQRKAVVVIFMEFHFPGEGHHGADLVVLLLGDIFIERQLVAYRRFT